MSRVCQTCRRVILHLLSCRYVKPGALTSHFVEAMLLNDFLTVEDLAERWHTTPAGVRQLHQRSAGPRAYRIGRRLLFAVEDVAAWEAGRAERGAA